MLWFLHIYSNHNVTLYGRAIEHLLGSMYSMYEGRVSTRAMIIFSGYYLLGDYKWLRRRDVYSKIGGRGCAMPIQSGTNSRCNYVNFKLPGWKNTKLCLRHNFFHYQLLDTPSKVAAENHTNRKIAQLSRFQFIHNMINYKHKNTSLTTEEKLSPLLLFMRKS